MALPNLFSNAVEVWFVALKANKYELINFSKSSSFIDLSIISNDSTDIVPSVKVPVLSKHKVSTLESNSTEYKSWAKVLFWASLTTPVAIATEAKRAIPQGII